MKISFRTRLSLLLFALISVALGVSGFFFLHLYSQDRIAQLYESRLTDVTQISSHLRDILLTANRASPLELTRSKDVLFAIDDPCGVQPRATLSSQHERAISELNQKLTDWIHLPEVKESCRTGKMTLIASAPKLLMSSGLFFFPPEVNGSRSTARLALISFDSVFDSSYGTRYFLIDSNGQLAWNDASTESLESLLTENRLTLPAVSDLAIQALPTDLPGVNRLGAEDAVVAFAPLLSQWVVVSLASERILAQGTRFAIQQSLLLITGFFFLCLWIARWISKKISQPLSELSEAAQSIAEGNLDVRIPESGQGLANSEEFSVVKKSFNQMTEQLGHLIEETRQRAQMDSDIHLARQVQELLLPNRSIEILGHEIHSHVQMANLCGGDWWGYLDSGDTGKAPPLLIMMIGDVTGHGVSSALITAAAQGSLAILAHWIQMQPELGKDPRTILTLFNRSVYVTSGGKLSMTFFTAVIDPLKDVIHFSNAGHNSPYVMPHGQNMIKPLVARGPVLGNRLDESFPDVQSAPWLPGDQLFLYTDGLTDCMRDGQSVYGRKELLKSLKSHAHLRGVNFLKAFLAERAALIGDLPQEDDVTAVVCVRKGAS